MCVLDSSHLSDCNHEASTGWSLLLFDAFDHTALLVIACLKHTAIQRVHLSMKPARGKSAVPMTTYEHL